MMYFVSDKTARELEMDEKIKDKVREIQHKYCGEPIEIKLYYAIKETMETRSD